MAAEDIQYLLFCEDTLLRPSSEPIDADWHKQELDRCTKEHNAAVDAGDSAKVALAMIYQNYLGKHFSEHPKVSYTVDSELLENMTEVYSKKYRIGVVVADKNAAIKALGRGSKDTIQLFTPAELEANQLFISDYSVIIMKGSLVKLMMYGVDYVHQYTSAEELDAFLDSPKLNWNYDETMTDMNSPAVYVATGLLILLGLGLILLLYFGMRQLFI